MTISFKIRDAKIDDISQICAIYAQSVQNETASWEYEAPSLEEMRNRFTKISANYPYLIAEIDNKIAGYAYASLFRGREGWRFACENSVYVDPIFQGNGIAKSLMIELCEKCREIGLKNMVAVIGDTENKASIALHKSLGFELVGILPKIGIKFGKNLDSVIMQKCIA